MNLTNISFNTDGKTIGVPAEKGKGSITIATKKELAEKSEEYMQYCQAYDNTREDVAKTESEKEDR